MRYIAIIFCFCCLLVSCAQEGSVPLETTPQPDEPSPPPERTVKNLPAQAAEMTLTIDAQGHSGKIQDVMFSPDGNTLFSVSNDKTVRVWDTQSGALKQTLRGYQQEGAEGKLYAGALAPNGRYMALGGFLGPEGGDADIRVTELEDLADFEFLVGQIRILDLERGTQLTSLKGHTNVILDLAFSPDGRRLASASADMMIRIWDFSDPEHPELIGLLEGHEAQVYGLAFSPDARQLVSASYDGTLRLWELPEHLTLAESILGLDCQVLQGHHAEVHSVAYSPDSRYIVSGGKDRRILLWSPEGKLLKEIDEYPGTISTLNFSQDGSKLIAAGDGDFIPQVYAVPSGDSINVFPAHRNSVTASAFYGNELIATAGADQTIYLWDAETGSQQTRMLSQGRPIWRLSFLEGLRVAFGNSDFSPEYFDDLPQRYLEYFPLEASFDFAEMALLPISSDDRLGEDFVSAQEEMLELFSPHELHIPGTGAIVRNDPARDGRIRAYTITANRTIVVGSSFSLKAYNMYGELLREFIGHTGEVFAVAVSEDGGLLASAGSDQSLKLWNLDSGESLVTLFVSTDREWVCWTPQGFYMTSPKGERYIGRHQNRGLEELADYAPVSAFQKLYHHPEIVRQSIAFRNFETALSDFKLAYHDSLEEHAVSQIAPPQIEWQSPAEFHTQTADDRIRVRAKIHANSANDISNLTLLLNDEAQQLSEKSLDFDSEHDTQQELDYEIQLSAKQNTLTILADTEFSSVRSEPRIVEFIPEQPNLILADDEESAEAPADDVPPTTPAPQRRLALLIGNADYQYSSDLPNPVNDAQQLEEALLKLGFEVQRYENSSQNAMKLAIDQFGDTLRDFDVGVFYYSGHGAQVNGENYLIPVDANLRSRYDAEFNAVNMGRVMRNMEYAGGATNIIILDACRDNPFAKSWAKSGGGGGLAFMDAPSGTLIAYATSPGKVAFDDPNSSNSIYTKALLQHIATPGLSILEMFQQVRSSVMELTDKEQTPWESTSLTGNFYFMH